VLPGNRELVSYYANSISHLLGPFADGVRQRDRLPSLASAAAEFITADHAPIEKAATSSTSR
jgi:hypothetical protein